jgi:hypothetical protein
MHAALTAAHISDAIVAGRALVIPAFELAMLEEPTVGADGSLPKSTAPAVAAAGKGEIQALCAGGQASAFHTGHFLPGHGPTETSRWLESERGYDVHYKDFYEPYVVAARANVPRYDERFRGYGLNKVSHLYAVAAAGATFHVWPAHFVVAEEHAKSASWGAVFSHKAKCVHRVRVAHLYQRFKCSLRALQGTCDPLPGAIRPIASEDQRGPELVQLGQLAVRAAHVDFRWVYSFTNNIRCNPVCA